MIHFPLAIFHLSFVIAAAPQFRRRQMKNGK